MAFDYVIQLVFERFCMLSGTKALKILKSAMGAVGGYLEYTGKYSMPIVVLSVFYKIWLARLFQIVMEWCIYINVRRKRSVILKK